MRRRLRLSRSSSRGDGTAATLARIVTGVMLLTMASPLAASASVDAVAGEIRRQLAVLLAVS